MRGVVAGRTDVGARGVPRLRRARPRVPSRTCVERPARGAARTSSGDRSRARSARSAGRTAGAVKPGRGAGRRAHGYAAVAAGVKRGEWRRRMESWRAAAGGGDRRRAGGGGRDDAGGAGRASGAARAGARVAPGDARVR